MASLTYIQRHRGLLLILAMVLTVAASADRALAGTASVSRGRDIAQYAISRLGQKVGDGQCAALAGMALRANGCKDSSQGPQGPTAHYVWGLKIREMSRWSDGGLVGSEDSIHSRYRVRTGDIIQFKNVRFKSNTSTSTYTHHTAIVESISSNSVTVLHQNVGQGTTAQRQRVQRKTLKLSEFVEGTMTFYRPLTR